MAEKKFKEMDFWKSVNTESKDGQDIHFGHLINLNALKPEQVTDLKEGLGKYGIKYNETSVKEDSPYAKKGETVLSVTEPDEIAKLRYQYWGYARQPGELPITMKKTEYLETLKAQEGKNAASTETPSKTNDEAVEEFKKKLDDLKAQKEAGRISDEQFNEQKKDLIGKYEGSVPEEILQENESVEQVSEQPAPTTTDDRDFVDPEAESAESSASPEQAAESKPAPTATPEPAPSPADGGATPPPVSPAPSSPSPTGPDESEEPLTSGTPTGANAEEEDIAEPPSEKPKNIDVPEAENEGTVFSGDTNAPSASETAEPKKTKYEPGRFVHATKESIDTFYKNVFEKDHKTAEDFADALLFNILAFPLNYMNAVLSYEDKKKLDELAKKIDEQSKGSSEKLKNIASLQYLMIKRDPQSFNEMYKGLGKTEGLTEKEVKAFMQSNPDLLAKMQKNLGEIAASPEGRAIIESIFPEGHNGKFSEKDLIGVLTGRFENDTNTKEQSRNTVPTNAAGNGNATAQDLLAVLKAAVSSKGTTVTLSNIGNPKVNQETGEINVEGARTGANRVGEQQIIQGGKASTSKRPAGNKAPQGTGDSGASVLKKTSASAGKPLSETQKIMEIAKESFYAKVDKLKISAEAKKAKKEAFDQYYSQHKRQAKRISKALELVGRKPDILAGIKLRKDQEINSTYIEKAREIDKDLKKVTTAIHLNNILINGQNLTPQQGKDKGKPGQKQTPGKKIGTPSPQKGTKSPQSSKTSGKTSEKEEIAPRVIRTLNNDSRN